MNPVPRRRGRPPGMSRTRLQKRYLIAAAIVARVKIAAVARQLGVSRSWASREAHAPDTKLLFAALLANRAEHLYQLVGIAIHAIESALSAEKQILRRRQISNVGPNYRVQLDAAKVALQFIKKLGHHPWAALEHAARRNTADLRVPIADGPPSRLEDLLDRSLQAIQHAFSAEKRVRRYGRVVTLGPDYRVRLEAARVALQFITKLCAHAGPRCARPVEHARLTKPTPVGTQSFRGRCRH